MIGILFTKIKILIRTPWSFLITTSAAIAFSLAFSYIISGNNMYGLQVPIVAENENVENSLIGEILTNSDAHNFNWVSKEEMDWKVQNGKVELGVILGEDRFEIIEAIHSQNVYLIEQTIRSAYVKQMQYDKIEANVLSLFPEEEIDQKLANITESSVFSIDKQPFKPSDGRKIDATYQPLFGFTLFFIIYTIAYNVLYILTEKQAGVWDRMILSPVRKWEMYVANFIYSFLTGYMQVALIFLVFRYIVGIDFHGNFLLTLLLVMPYVFAIVSMSILLTGLVKTVQQFNAVIPIVAVSMAMIGGAYWPLEVVESELILNLSKIVPITYGMELLNGVAVYGYPVSELLLPLSVLLLMGVVMTGIGIHLMERRHV